MTSKNPDEAISHVEIAALVMRLALKRLDGCAHAPDFEGIKKILDRWIENSIAE